MDEVGKDGEFLAPLDLVAVPIVGKLVAGFLPGHPLGDPLLATSMSLPGFAGAVQRERRIGHLLHAFIAHLGQPQLDGLGLRAGHGLHKAQQGFGCGYVGQPLPAITRGHFQLVTICHQLAAFLHQALFELAPVLAGGLIIRLLRQHLDDIDDREPPGFGRFVIDATDFVFLENGRLVFHGAAL